MNINVGFLFSQIVNFLVMVIPLLLLILIGISVNRRFRNIENHLAEIEKALKKEVLTQEDT